MSYAGSDTFKLLKRHQLPVTKIKISPPTTACFIPLDAAHCTRARTSASPQFTTVLWLAREKQMMAHGVFGACVATDAIPTKMKLFQLQATDVKRLTQPTLNKGKLTSTPVSFLLKSQQSPLPLWPHGRSYARAGLHLQRDVCRHRQPHESTQRRTQDQLLKQLRK